MSKKNNQQLLDELKQEIIEQKVCSELAQTATQLVFGDGDPEAELVFIGEAPGKKEDEQGIPFVGAAGKFLGEMLEMINLERKNIYITNIVKYRPPNNRDPLPEEKDSFLPFLRKQIEIIKPKLVITLGRHSMNSFLPGLSISQVHGQPKRIKLSLSSWQKAPGSLKFTGDPGVSGVQGNNKKRTNRTGSTESESRKKLTQQSTTNKTSVSSSADEQGFVTWVILPLFHPAAALYNGGLRQTLIDDFARIPIILKKIK